MSTSFNHWNPMRELEDFQRRILGAFSPGRSGGSGNGHEALSPTEWTPLVDILEDEKGYMICVELPELGKDDVKVMMENGMLTIRGERRFPAEDKTRKYHRVERFYGPFSRNFAMPDDGDPSSVKADFKDGVLKIRIAKSEAARPRQIEVKLG